MLSAESWTSAYPAFSTPRTVHQYDSMTQASARTGPPLWFATVMNGPSEGTCSAPSASHRK